ncbi:PLP-dependent aminotransferase family protein [Paucibacter sp. APW11]|uniref:PLP-dependent aminotransferase family protein n=1 Tax=Roseateles aquae TaxID=3077235 RepID=A0ABU3PBT4_9BURK|nr:PLP-dependent aminotransferase family protein [Paucibacter sp. APW11]MDT8999608.1 PLP-dependent aminotransferase family protein [Paucibacter sp. APW11]
MDWSLLRHPALIRALQGSPLYAALASAMQGLILGGELLPGDRLPPERLMAERLGISRSTVVAAYARLAEAGWVNARQGQGTTVSAGPPGHVAASKRAVRLGNPALRREGSGDPAWVDFALATAVPELAWLQPSAQAASLVLRESAYQPEGMLPLRERIAARYSRQGLPTMPAQVLVCAGAQQAISLLAQHFLQRGDRVLLESPNYFGALDVFRSAGAILDELPVQARAAHAPAFSAALAGGRHKLAYVCPSLHNPCGISWSRSASERLARTAAQGSGLLLVDDSLAELHFAQTPAPLPVPRGAPIVHIGSLSKTLWAGLRIGWLRAPEPLIEALRRAKASADIACSALSSALACDLLDRYDALLAPRREQLQSQAELLLDGLHRLLPQWRVQRPEGGLFLWAELPPRGPDAEAWVEAAAAQRVKLTPGSAMSAHAGFQRHLRLAFTQPAAQALEGLSRLAAIAEEGPTPSSPGMQPDQTGAARGPTSPATRAR